METTTIKINFEIEDFPALLIRENGEVKVQFDAEALSKLILNATRVYIAI